MIFLTLYVQTEHSNNFFIFLSIKGTKFALIFKRKAKDLDFEPFFLFLVCVFQ